MAKQVDLNDQEPPEIEEIEALATVRQLGTGRYEIELDEDHARRMRIGRMLTVTIRAQRIDVGVRAFGLPGIITLTPKPDAVEGQRASAAANPLRYAMFALLLQFQRGR